MTNPTPPIPHHAESPDAALYDGPKAAFIINYVPLGANCLDVAFPDIGGIGVVLSTVIQAFLTTVALIIVTYLDHRIKKNEVLDIICKKLNWWKNALSAFIYISGDTALIYALALLTSAYANLRFTPDRKASLLHYQDAYFTLCTYMCCAFSSVHLASLLVLRDRIRNHRRTTTVRAVLLATFGTMLIITVSLSWPAFEPFFVLMDRLLVLRMKLPQGFEYFLEYFLPALAMAYTFWVSVWQVLGRNIVDKRPRRPWKLVLHYLCFASWRVVFVLQVLCAMLSISFILAQKFITAPAPTQEDRERGIGQWCSLNNAKDNQWGFSQTLAMLLLLVPFYAAAEATCEHVPVAKQAKDLELQNLERGYNAVLRGSQRLGSDASKHPLWRSYHHSSEVSALPLWSPSRHGSDASNLPISPPPSFGFGVDVRRSSTN